MRIEDQLKDLIIHRYGTMINFSNEIGLANSTMATLMKNGLEKSSLTNIFKICNALGISVDALAIGRIIPIDRSKKTEHLEDIYSDIKLRFESQNITLQGIHLDQSEKDRLLFLLETGIEMIRRDRKQ